ncbi:conserved exported protein of unknown function [Nitrospira moscoviensis]|uniref:Uncharacterized protein n=2 Tax=Nitrospira moscoviensis TaxID=42253 RepID=A0A0K2GIG8_NITMO|nr:conserved exported protein of unknown function [Nitrospira moscoviensis]
MRFIHWLIREAVMAAGVTRAGWSAVGLAGMLAIGSGSAWAIDVKLSQEEAQKALEAGRVPMEKANTPEDVKKVLQQASLATRVGADPEKDPCGTSAILRTKRYRLEAFGRQEAAESKKQKKDVRMPEEFIRKVVDMPNMEVEVQLCGDDEYFAEGVQIALQQGSKTIKPVDVSPAERGRKNEGGNGPAYRSRFTARFAYESFDPNAKTKVIVFFPDGKMSEFEADFSKVK